MPHIKKQKVVYNDDGTIRSGSASIVDTVYDNKRKGRCSHSCCWQAIQRNQGKRLKNDYKYKGRGNDLCSVFVSRIIIIVKLTKNIVILTIQVFWFVV